MRAHAAVVGLALALGWGSRAFAKPKPSCTVTVAAGDTVSRIAALHHVDEQRLIDNNPQLQENPDLLRVGQTLDVCIAKTGRRRCAGGGRIVEHKVRKGETLGGIAGFYGVPKKAVTDYTQSLRDDPHTLRVGQEVKVCVAEPARGGGGAKVSKACDGLTPVHRHEVVPGEHLGQIAGRYGVRKRDLLRLNARLREDPDLLRVGQPIRVCPVIAPRERTRIRYTVQSGDTLGSIANRYGLTPRELGRYQQGKLKNPDALREGQSLTVWVDGGIVADFAKVDRDKGRLEAGVQLPPGRGYVVKWKAGAWGTGKTIRLIQAAVASYKRTLPGGPKVHIGDISKRGGGKFRPHLSHQHGRDVDVGYVLVGKYAHEKRFRAAHANNLDRSRTWTLIKAFIDSEEVTYIFVDYRIQKLLYEHAKERGYAEDTLDELFQYPRGRRRAHGLIRHWKGHHNHFHVRFRK